jgi:hypothetical protein
MIADNRLARALNDLIKSAEKGGNTSQPIQAVRDFETHASDQGLRSAVSRASVALCSSPAHRAQMPAEDVLALLRPLIENELTNSAAVTFLALVQPLKVLDIQAILFLAPTVECLAAWIKVARVSKKLVEEKILAAPDLAWRTAALDWYMEKGTIRRAAPLFSNLPSKSPRPRHLPQWEEVLVETMRTAKGQVLLEVILEGTSSDPLQLASLTTVSLNSPALLSKIAELLPDILENRASGQALDFCKNLLDQALLAPPPHRPFVSAGIARLATGLLLKGDLSAIQGQTLRAIGEVMSCLRIAAADEDLKARTWIIEPLKTAAERPGENQNLTMLGARHIAVAFEKARQGLSAHAVLSMTAKNLGMAGIGTKGENVPYNPVQHEDVRGGILPGEIVQITDPGWTFRNSVVLRALVARPNAPPIPTGV